MRPHGSGAPRGCCRASSSAAARGSAGGEKHSKPQKIHRCFFFSRKGRAGWPRSPQWPHLRLARAPPASSPPPSSVLAAPRPTAAQPARPRTGAWGTMCAARALPWRTSSTECRRGLWQRLCWAARFCALSDGLGTGRGPLLHGNLWASQLPGPLWPLNPLLELAPRRRRAFGLAFFSPFLCALQASSSAAAAASKALSPPKKFIYSKTLGPPAQARSWHCTCRSGLRSCSTGADGRRK